MHIIKTTASVSTKILHSDKDHQMPFVGGLNTRSTNPRWRTAAILKNRHISIAVWPILTKSGTATQFDPLEPSDRQKFRISKIQDGGCRHLRHLEKSKYRHISATVGPIATKFGTLTQFDPLDHSLSKVGPSSCTF